MANVVSPALGAGIADPRVNNLAGYRTDGCGLHMTTGIDLFSGVEELRRRADAGDREACNRLGMHLLEHAPDVPPPQHGRVMTAAEAEAARWAEINHRSAVLEDAYIGMMYRSQDEDPALLQQEYEELAASLNRRVADAAASRHSIAQSVERVAARQEYLEQAAHYFQQAANLGDPEGMWNLGWRYFLGQGVAQDERQALFWWRSAAALNHAAALARLVEMNATPGSAAPSHSSPAGSLHAEQGEEMQAPIVILFLAAEPTDLVRLRLGREAREIQEKLQLAKFRDGFRFEQRHAVRPADLTQALLDYAPQIVHFAGHGAASGEICLEDVSGRAHPVTPQALQAVFDPLADAVRCVVLNACYSVRQAEAIARHIPYVVGVAQEIDDEAATAFAVGFYQAIGAGLSIEKAVTLGNAQMSMLGYDSAAATLHRRASL